MDATLCILAGGESRRMGVSKAELRVRDQPILAYLLERFHWDGPTLLVTAPSRRSPPAVELFDREVIDPIDGAGPLCGVLSALENVATSLAIIATVDMPGIGPIQLQWLRDQLPVTSPSLGVMGRRDQHVEPFPSIYRAGSAVQVVRDQFGRGERSVAALAKLPEFRAIDLPISWDDHTWVNLNTRDNFAKFVASLRPT